MLFRREQKKIKSHRLSSCRIHKFQMDNDTLSLSKGHDSITNKQQNRKKTTKKNKNLYKMLSRSLNATSRLKKRERTQNWAFEEKRYLLELCKRDMNIIENKRLDADLTALKNRAWKSVHEEFCKVFGNERNCNRLKEQWRRMKGIHSLFIFIISFFISYS